MPDKVITITTENACCCTSGATVDHECRSKSGTAAGLEPDAPVDSSSGSCENPREGDFSYEVEDCFGVLDPTSPNYSAPGLPVIKMTVSFHVRYYTGPDSCDPVLSDDGFCLEGAFDTMIEITALVIEFDDVDVSYTPGGEGVRATDWGGALATVGAPINLGWCNSGEKVIEGVFDIPATYYEETLDITYNLSHGTRTDLAWPTLCGLCLEDGGANVLPENRLPGIIADANPWDGSTCDQEVSAASGNPSSFTYTVVQFRALCSGLTNAVDYDVTFEILKFEAEAPIPGWYAHADVHYLFTASGSTHTGTWIDLTTELSLGAGQYRVSGATIAAA